LGPAHEASIPAVHPFALGVIEGRVVDAGAVRLCGTFSGAGIDLREVDRLPAAKTERRGSGSRGRERLRRQQENPSKP